MTTLSSRATGAEALRSFRFKALGGTVYWISASLFYAMTDGQTSRRATSATDTTDSVYMSFEELQITAQRLHLKGETIVTSLRRLRSSDCELGSSK